MSAVRKSTAIERNPVLDREQTWELRLTRQEIEQLQREKQHLDSKAIERPLTTWEKLRQQQLFQDLSALFQRAKGLREYENRV